MLDFIRTTPYQETKSHPWLEVSTLEVLSPESRGSKKTTQETVLLKLYIPKECDLQICAKALLELKRMADKLIENNQLKLLEGWEITQDHIGQFLDVVDNKEQIEKITLGNIRADDIYECIPLITYWNKTIGMTKLLKWYLKRSR